MKVSIIMPVYNSEKYLTKSIQSVLEQSYSEWELIIINDGSTDDSINICRKYCESDERIKVITTKNEGVSRARNRGIVEASGEFLLFLDSDDVISKDCLSNSIDCISKSNADICIFGFFSVNEMGETKKICPLETSEILKEEFFKNNLAYFFDNSLLHCVGNKLYRKSLVGNECFEEEWSYHEDIMFALKNIAKAQTIVTISEAYYLYNCIEDSLSHQVKLGRYVAAEKIYCYVHKEMPLATEMPAFEKELNNFLYYNLLGELKTLTKVYGDKKRIWLQKVKELNGNKIGTVKIINSKISSWKNIGVFFLFKMHMYRLLYVACLWGKRRNEE